ncbi:ABC transporter ATP-binding protein [Lacihabitans sp. LS3-19]|uniref:ABC transporter ATP-binding protein n=1 Tax=Lacihabitans sp. LS3-19 TaxID=2487335 RepID=UPI0020CEFDEA|nr:ATP-binding cassette domain-containing protein [Lacihabitans sp. LS3-19]MCP9767058.1 ABC transporter ATP-binding protein [Lacihabitans sp. LS3-19]
MTNISLENIGKKFKNEWIFRNLSFEFSKNEPIAIIGPNGSGKSTLMQAIAGMIPVNEGFVRYFEHTIEIPEESWHKLLSFSSPYLELIEEFTLQETVNFHVKFKPFINGLSTEEFLQIIELENHSNKPIKNFSSGMRQKLKLGLSFYSQNEIILLDEPTANLDQKGFEWYQKQVLNALNNKIVLVSSNEPKEYDFCKKHLNILNFKK